MRLITGKELKSAAPYIFDGSKFAVHEAYVTLPIVRLYAFSTGNMREVPMSNAAGESFLSYRAKYYAVAHPSVKLPPHFGLHIMARPENGDVLDITPAFYPPRAEAIEIEVGAFLQTFKIYRLEGGPHIFAAYLYDYGGGREAVYAPDVAAKKQAEVAVA